MRRHAKIALVCLAAALALTGGLVAATVFAQSPEDVASSDETPGQIFIGKVADILGLEEEQVADAFSQARQEMRDEFQQQRLQQAIEDGLITEEEAEQIQEWWDSRPEAMEQLGPMGGFHMRNCWRHQVNLP